MLTIFKMKQDRQPPRIPPNLNNIRQVITANVERLIDYWREMNWAVRSEHILNTVLTAMYTGYTDPFDIYNSANNQIGNIANPRGIVHNLHYGRLQPIPHFYGKGNSEILIHQNFDDSIDLISRGDYLYWDSVRVVYHPFTAFDFRLANGLTNSDNEVGFCILKVDLALLFTQYQLWLQDKSQSQYQDGTQKTSMNFLHSVVIPNILKTHVEQVWFNRLIHTSFNLPKNDSRGDRRLALPDPYQFVNDTQIKLISDIKRGRGNWHEWLCSIPGIYTKNWKTFLMQDDILETQQIELSWVLGRFKAVEWLVDMELEVQTKANGQYRNELVRYITTMKQDRTLGTIRGLRYQDMEKLFDELLVKVNRL